VKLATYACDSPDTLCPMAAGTYVPLIHVLVAPGYASRWNE